MATGLIGGYSDCHTKGWSDDAAGIQTLKESIEAIKLLGLHLLLLGTLLLLKKVQ
jgi:hypothetical protein